MMGTVLEQDNMWRVSVFCIILSVLCLDTAENNNRHIKDLDSGVLTAHFGKEKLEQSVLSGVNEYSGDTRGKRIMDKGEKRKNGKGKKGKKGKRLKGKK